MTRPRRTGQLAAALALVGLLLLPAPAATPAPNPFGDRSTETTIVLHRDGSYDVALRQTVELRLAYDLTLGGGLHDGFRLTDDLTSLPPYLRAAYTLTSFTVAEGQPRPVEFTRRHHLLSASSRGSYPIGTHTADIRHRVTGAAQPTTSGYQVHVRLLGIGYGPGDRLEIDASELSATRLMLRCVTFPPDTEACGTVAGSTLTEVFGPDLDQDLPPEFRVDVTADNADVPQPQVDRG